MYDLLCAYCRESPNSEVLRISYIDMYPGHNPYQDIFTHAFRAVLIKGTLEVVQYRDSPDILIIGPYSYESASLDIKPNLASIYYSGENSRPNYYYSDYSITHDVYDYGLKNFRFPYWMTEIDWFGLPVQHKLEERLDPLLLFSKNQSLCETESQFLSRTNSVVTFISNPTILRSSLIDAMSRRGMNISGFGRAFNRRIDSSKYEIASKYIFYLAFENSLYPGYVTEKLFHAYRSGCIPLYWGDKQAYSDFHLASELNLAEYSNINDYIEYIFSLFSKKPEELFGLVNQSYLSPASAKIGPLLAWLSKLIGVIWELM